MEQERRRNNTVYSVKVRAGKRRTYFLDVRETRSNDYYLTITESKKRFDEEGYDRHKIFLYKEDFNKFLDALQETIDYIKTNLMPEYDFDEFSQPNERLVDEGSGGEEPEDHAPESSEKDEDQGAQPEEDDEDLRWNA